MMRCLSQPRSMRAAMYCFMSVAAGEFETSRGVLQVGQRTSRATSFTVSPGGGRGSAARASRASRMPPPPHSWSIAVVSWAGSVTSPTTFRAIRPWGSMTNVSGRPVSW